MRSSTVYSELIAVIFLLSANSAIAETFTFLAGNMDNYAMPADPASPSTALLAAFGNPTTIVDFDVVEKNTRLGHTFTDLPENIVEASLEINMKAVGESFPDTDSLRLLAIDESWTNVTHWSRNIIALQNDFGVENPGWYFQQWTFTLDLSQLPTNTGSIDIIPKLNEYGLLDFWIEDDTAVDYLKLVIETNPVPEPSTAALFFGLLALGLFPIRRGQLQSR